MTTKSRTSGITRTRGKHRQHQMNHKSLANLDLAPRFQPGQSGSPGGKPWQVTGHLRDILAEPSDDGSSVKARDVAKSIVQTACLPNSRGYATALTQLLDRTEGKVPGDGVQVNFNTIEVVIVEASPPPQIVISTEVI